MFFHVDEARAVHRKDSAASRTVLLLFFLSCLPVQAVAQSLGWFDLPVRSYSGPPLESFQALAPDSCYIAPLSGASAHQKSRLLRSSPIALGWVTAGAWYQDTLVLADVENERFIGLSPRPSTPSAGLSATASISKPERGVSPFFLTERFDNGYLIGELITDSFTKRVRLADRDGNTEQILFLRGRQVEDRRRGEDVIGLGMLQLTPMNEGVFFLADIRYDSDPDSYWTEFAFLEKRGDELFFKTFELDLAEDIRKTRILLRDQLQPKFYKRDFKLTTSIRQGGEDMALILVMEEEPWIGRVRQADSEIARLPEFPVDLRLPQHQWVEPTNRDEELRGFRDVYQMMEQHAVPVGLYTWQNEPYLLFKSAAAGDGRSSWYLQRFSVENGRGLGDTVELPMRAEHLMLVPAREGGEFFAAIPKGPVDIFRNGLPRPNVPSVVLHRPAERAILFPGSWVSDPEPLVRKSPCTEILLQISYF